MTISGHKSTTGNALFWVRDKVMADHFPPVQSALRDPDGLLAIGGDLKSGRLLEAYRHGIFPWYSQGQPILWWSPDPRCVIEPHGLNISRSLKKSLRKRTFRVTFNRAFGEVMRGCAGPRKLGHDTWLTREMAVAYYRLHVQGDALSVECWKDDRLAGGLYGVCIGRVFFGESMFSRETDASKVALVHLAHELQQRNFRLIDCQVHSPHLQSLGATPMPRKLFVNILKQHCTVPGPRDWPEGIAPAMTRVQKLGFYATPRHDCNYLPGREATTLFADPRFPKNSRLYAALAECGFRRSGEHLYIPHCGDCQACIPVRIPVDEFRRTRLQNRTWRRNADIEIRALPAEYRPEHFALYRDYLAARHAGGGMDNPTPETYVEFLAAAWSDTVFFEMRLSGRLIGVAVADLMQNALLAVYTFFDPACHTRSLGRFAVLYEIEEARRRGLQWIYLGYWIEQCRKMNYKNEYRPLEYYVDNQWRRCIDRAPGTPSPE